MKYGSALLIGRRCYDFINKWLLRLQWDKKVFCQPLIVQFLPLKMFTEVCNFHHRHTSAVRDRMCGGVTL